MADQLTQESQASGENKTYNALQIRHYLVKHEIHQGDERRLLTPEQDAALRQAHAQKGENQSLMDFCREMADRLTQENQATGENKTYTEKQIRKYLTHHGIHQAKTREEASKGKRLLTPEQEEVLRRAYEQRDDSQTLADFYREMADQLTQESQASGENKTYTKKQIGNYVHVHKSRIFGGDQSDDERENIEKRTENEVALALLELSRAAPGRGQSKTQSSSPEGSFKAKRGRREVEEAVSQTASEDHEESDSDLGSDDSERENELDE